MTDPLAAWPAFDVDADTLGESIDRAPGLRRPGIEVDPRGPLVTIAGGWAQSTHLGPAGPGVFLRLALRANGYPDHHKLEALVLDDTATQLGVVLYGAGQRAPLDEAAAQLWDQL